MRVRLTQKDGTFVFSEFQKKQNLKTLLTRRSVIPVWRIVSAVHPITGEPTPMRSRELVRADAITGACEVDEQNNPIVSPPRGSFGRLTIPPLHESGLPIGTVVVVHRDPASLRRFIITQWAEDEAARQVFWIDADNSSPDYDEDAANGHEPGIDVDPADDEDEEGDER